MPCLFENKIISIYGAAFLTKMYDYKILDVTDNLRIALKDDMLEQYTINSAGKNFVKTMGTLANNIAALPINFKQPLRFSFLVIPSGTEFSSAVGLPIEEGMCEAPIQLDKNYPLSLCVDYNWFATGFKNLDFQSKIGLTHELAHIVHGGYFRNLGQISEGFAELLPHYLMNFEGRNLKHQKAISSFQEKDMLNMAFLNQNGMFAVDEVDGRETQQLKSYMSVYLWMLAYTKRVENIYRLNKFEATNFILNEFSKVDNLRWNDKTIAIADMVKMPRDEVMNGLTLQKEGKQYVVNTIIHRKLKQTNSLSK